MLLQAKQMHKMTSVSLKMVEVVILSVAQHDSVISHVLIVTTPEKPTQK